MNTAQPSCAKCGSGAFVLVATERGAPLRGLTLVQCGECGAPIGAVTAVTVDGPDIGERLAEQTRALDGLSARLSNLEETLAHVLNQLRYE
jgi:hypothetical protein